MTEEEKDLRDFFAGQVITGLVSNVETISECAEIALRKGKTTNQIISQMAYAIADAMLKEKEGAGEEEE